MHLVVAVLKPSHLEAVRQALAAVHVTRLTICDAQGYGAVFPPGRDAGYDADRIGVVQQSVMEIAVNDDFLERTVDTIRKAMRMGNSARGGGADDLPSLDEHLFVLPIHEAVQIYREVRGPEAV